MECSVEECSRPVTARGWCSLHWERWSVTGDPMGTKKRPPDISMAEWFWTRLAPPNDQGCREWTGARVSSPHAAVGAPKYGQTARGDGTTKRVLVHRYAWELTYGPIPDGMLVCHSCDNPPCCEPTHLFLGTPADNMRDKIQKGRARSK